MQRVGYIPRARLTCLLERHPHLMANALKSPRLTTLQDIFENRVGLSESEWKQLVKKSRRGKGVFSHRWSRSNLRQVLYLLQDHVGMSNAQIIKLFLTQPQLLQYHNAKWKGLVNCFESSFLAPWLAKEDLCKIICKAPMLVTYSVEKQLQPTLAFVHTLASAERVAHIVTSHPRVLTYSVTKVWEPQLAFLARRLALENRPQNEAAHIICKFPPLVWLKADLVDQKVTFLQERLQLSLPQVRYLVASFPQVLGLSVEQNLEKKVDFLLDFLTLEELQDFLLYQPSLLAYSLENRLRPRLELMKQHDISFAYSPRYLMSLSNAKFEQW